MIGFCVVAIQEGMPTISHRQGVPSSRVGFQRDALPLPSSLVHPRVHDASRNGYMRRLWRVSAGNNVTVDGQEGLISDSTASDSMDRPTLSKAPKGRYGLANPGWSTEARAKGSASAKPKDISDVDEGQGSDGAPGTPVQQREAEQAGTSQRQSTSNRWKFYPGRKSTQSRSSTELDTSTVQNSGGSVQHCIPSPTRPANSSKRAGSRWEPYRAQSLHSTSSQVRSKHRFKGNRNEGAGSGEFSMSASTDTKFRSIAHISGSKKGLEVFIPSEAKENDRTVATGFPTQIGYTIPVNNRKQIRYTAIKVRQIIESTMKGVLEQDRAPSILSTNLRPLKGGLGGTASQCRALNVMLDPSSIGTVAKNQIIYNVKQMLDSCKSDSRAGEGWTVLDVDGTMDNEDAEENTSLGVDILGCFLVLLRPEDKRIPVLVYEVLRDAGIEQAKDSIEIYNYLLHGCDMEGYGPLATKLLEVMQDRGVTPDVMSYNWAIGAYARMPDEQKVEDLFAEMKSNGFTPSTPTYRKLMYTAAQSCDWEGALRILEDMKQNHVPRDFMTYRYLVLALINCGEDEMALKCLEWIATDDVAVDWSLFSSLLQHFLLNRMDLETSMNIISSAKGFGVHIKTKGVCDLIMRSDLAGKSLVKLLAHMRETGVMQNTKGSEDIGDSLRNMYSKLLRTLGSTDNCLEDVSKADQCWLLYETAKKEEKNDHPFLLKNVALCSGLSGNWERVHIVCEDAFKSEINAETLESMLTKLIDCAGRGGFYDDADALFEKACQDDRTSSRLYNSIIRCFRNDPQKCLNLFKRMDEAGITGEKWTYETLIKSAVRGSLIEEMRMVWESMVSHGFVPSYLIYNQLINGFARAGMEDDAFDVYLKMQEPITNFENVNFQSLCEIISSNFSRFDVLSHSLKLWMLGEKVDPCFVTRATAVKNSEKNARWKEVIKLYDGQKPYKCYFLKMRPTEATFVPLLVVSKVNKSVKRLSIIEQGMEEYNVQPNKRVLDAAVRYYTAIGELDKALEMIRKGKKAGILLTSSLWSALIYCCKSENVQNGWVRALDLFSRAQREGIPITSRHFHAMIEVSISKHKTGAAINMLQRMRSQQRWPGKHTHDIIQSYLVKNHEWHLASVVLLDAIHQGEIQDFASSKPNTINLHQMTKSIAQVAMRLWLHHLRQDARRGIFLNDSCIDIVIGDEENAEDDEASEIRSTIESLLSDGRIGAKLSPTVFVPSEDKPEVLVLSRRPFYDWLRNPNIDLGLDESFDSKKLDPSTNFSE